MREKNRRRADCRQTSPHLPQTTIQEFKRRLEGVSETPAETIRLIYRGRVLKNTDNETQAPNTLASYGVEHEHVLHLVTRAGGGSSANGVQLAGSPPLSGVARAACVSLDSCPEEKTSLLPSCPPQTTRTSRKLPASTRRDIHGP